MKIATKTIAYLLVLVMMLSLLAACKNDAPDVVETNAPQETEEAIGRENTPDNLPNNLNFGKDEVWFFYSDINDNCMGLETEGAVVGDATEQAVYERNTAVEDRLNIIISYIKNEGVTSQSKHNQAIENMILTGNGEVDVFLNMGSVATTGAVSGLYRQVTDLQYMDLGQPWWFSEQMASISFNSNKMYLLMGDSLISNYRDMTTIFFNKDLFESIFSSQGKDPDDLYDLVLNGQWTWAEYYTLVSDAYIDDGNGFKSIGDIFGAHNEGTNSWRTGQYYPYASGVTFTTRDDEGFPVLNYNTPKTIDLVEDFYSFVHENEGVMEMTIDEARVEFNASRLLFFAFLLGEGRKISASATFDYGILPFPKYDETCEYTTALLTGVSVYVLPKNLADDRLGIVGATLEALCAESYRNVSLEYYTSVLKLRGGDSQQDVEMIDFMRSNVRFDYSFWGGTSIGQINRLFRKLVIEGASKDFVSFWLNNGTSYENALEKLVNDYKNP